MEELQANFTEIYAKLGQEKQKNALLATNYEIIREGIKSINEKTESLRLQYEIEAVQQFSQLEKNTADKCTALTITINSATIAEQALLTTLSEDEAKNWRQGYSKYSLLNSISKISIQQVKINWHMPLDSRTWSSSINKANKKCLISR